MNKKRGKRFAALSVALMMALTLSMVINPVHAEGSMGVAISTNPAENSSLETKTDVLTTEKEDTPEQETTIQKNESKEEKPEEASSKMKEATKPLTTLSADDQASSLMETTEEEETELEISPESNSHSLKAPNGSFSSRRGGIQEIDGKLYLYDEEGTLRKDNKWVKYAGKYYFPNAEGVLYRDRIITFGSKVAFYMDHDGTFATGFREVGGWLMYFRDDGVRANDNAWVETERGWIFPNAEGEVYHDRIITFGSKVAYYMQSDGAYATGFQEINGKLMYFRENGVRANDNAWVQTERGWIFPNAEGILYRDQFITFGSKVAFYMQHDGTYAKGFQEINGKLMYFHENGVRANDNAWVQTERGWIFPNAQGVLYRNRFITFGPRGAYLMGSDGTKQTGVTRFLGALYPLDPTTGVLMDLSVGYHTIEGRRYYVRADGTIADGGRWIEKDGRRYFENVDGTYFRNQQISFGTVYYYMDADGATASGIHRAGRNYYFYDPANGNQRRNTEGLLEWQGNQYYIGSDAAIATNQFVMIGNKGYDADGSGILHPTSRRLIIDLSTHQKPYNFDFDKFSKGISGVILRAGYTGHGTGNSYYQDAEFERFYNEFNSRGVPIGAYWYSCANEVKEGKAEAQAFQNIIAGKKFALPVYWDTEDVYHQRKTDKKTLTDTALAFLQEMERKGYYTGIYSSSSWLRDNLEMSRLGNYDIWVAHYGVSKPSYRGEYGMWQFTSTYHKEGYPYGVDASWVFKDYPSIIKGAGLNGY